MIITFFRSSSFTQFDICRASWTFQYALGMKSPSNPAAARGTIVHKGYELLSRQKLAQQNGDPTFTDDEIGREFPTGELEAAPAIDLAFDYYTAKEDHIDWSPADRRTCQKLMRMALEMDGGLWDPRNRKIVAPELYFEFAIEKDWAAYDYTLPDGSKLQGYLGLKGTVDLLTDVGNNTYEYIDLKTGRRVDYSIDNYSKSIKDWKKLRRDAQLSIYFYALSRLFPNVDVITMSILYVKDGGCFSLPYGREDIAKIERMLKNRFDEIRNMQTPHFRISKRCTQYCHFGRTPHLDHEGNPTGKTICEHMRGEIRDKGMAQVLKDYVDVSALTSYGSGGGRSEGTTEALGR